MLICKNLTLRRGLKVLFADVNLQIYNGEKIAIIGKNGAGKSSFFQLIKGELHEDAGEFSAPPISDNWQVAEVAQSMPDTDESATDFVIAGDKKLLAVREKLKHAEEINDGNAIANAHIELAEAGEYDIRARAQSIILGLGFNLKELDNPVNSFSGGWRMRLQLARTLIAHSDLMLLDEPTNHLDLPSIIWLENYLQKYKGTLLLISHDREFLDAIVKATLHIDGGKITRYGGNYSTFEILRAQKLTLQMAQYQKQQKQIEHFQSFINRFRAKATKAKQAQSRIKALERIEKIAPVIADAEFSFEFRESEKIPNPLITIEKVDCGYQKIDENNDKKVIINNLSMSILSGQRVGILGANGQGKSTFIKTIANTLKPINGTITCGKGLVIGYFAQHELDLLTPENTPLQHFLKMIDERGEKTREVEIRGFLGSFNFSGDAVHQVVGTMSGGEKSRLVLAMIVWQKPNLLLLDEPTNHLDINTREALAMAINEFAGTVLLVSHDRSLLASVCEEFWLVENGQISEFTGDLNDYREYLFAQEKSRSAKEKAETKSAKTVQNNSSTPTNDNSKKNKKDLALIESQIRELENKIKIAETKSINQLDPASRPEHFRNIKNWRDEHSDLEEKWLQLYEQIQ